MKITVPAIQRETVGWRFSYVGSETVYYDVGRRTNKPSLRQRVTAVYETRVVPKVAFDYDFQIARRLTGVSLLAITAVAVGVAVPVLAAASIFAVVRDAVEAGLRRIQHVYTVLVTEDFKVVREAVEYAFEEITAR